MTTSNNAAANKRPFRQTLLAEAPDGDLPRDGYKMSPGDLKAMPKATTLRHLGVAGCLFIMLMACSDSPEQRVRKPDGEAEGAPVNAPILRLVDVHSRSLKRTTVLPHPSLTSPDGNNGIWCATWQMAWDAMRRGLVGGGQLNVAGVGLAEKVRFLNESYYPDNGVSVAARVAMAGWIQNGIVDDIHAELSRKFPGVQIEVAPPEVTAGPVAFAYLKKELQFAVPFEPVRWDVRFRGTDRTPLWFGVQADSSNPRRDEMRRQVSVSAAGPRVEEDGNNREALEKHVVMIKCAEEEETLVLAAGAAGSTLKEKWDSVQREMSLGKWRTLMEGDVLAIPKFNFAIRHDFEEFSGAELTCPMYTGPIAVAQQVVEFRLDENGVRMSSMARMVLGEPEEYVFDRPFLVALQRRGAPQPYFLMWVANDELLAEGVGQ